jgi:hypothetical protein
MAHFARLDSDNKVIDTIFIENKYILDENGLESESVGIAHLKGHEGASNNFIQYSINDNIRGHSAVIGGYYVPNLDVFTSVKPYDSWVLSDDNYNWVPPVDPPTLEEGKACVWDQVSGQYVIYDIVEATPEEETEEETEE